MLIPLLLLIIGSVIGFIKNRHDIADVMWGLWFVAFAIENFLAVPNYNFQSIILLLMVFIWGLRLSAHIGKRFLKKSSMDKRYVELLKRSSPLIIFFKVYILQAILAFVVLSPVTLFFIQQESTFLPIFALGVAVFLIGFGFEVIGDYQLSKFLGDKKNKGKILNSGLWKYTRHPNYFGEVLLWWGVFIATLASLQSFVGIIGPITISFLILKVSGVPMLEKNMANNPKYAKYIESTSMFWPRKTK